MQRDLSKCGKAGLLSLLKQHWNFWMALSPLHISHSSTRNGLPSYFTSPNIWVFSNNTRWVVLFLTLILLGGPKVVVSLYRLSAPMTSRAGTPCAGFQVSACRFPSEVPLDKSKEKGVGKGAINYICFIEFCDSMVAHQQGRTSSCCSSLQLHKEDHLTLGILFLPCQTEIRSV